MSSSDEEIEGDTEAQTPQLDAFNQQNHNGLEMNIPVVNQAVNNLIFNPEPVFPNP